MSSHTQSRKCAFTATLLGICIGLTLSSIEASGADRAVESEQVDPPAEVTNADSDELLDLSSGPVVDHIRWTGVTAFKEDVLEDRIVTSVQPRFRLRFWKPKNRLDDFVLEEDVDRIVEAYSEIGYFSAQVSTQVDTLPNGHVVVEFDVKEGRGVTLEAWSLEIVSDETGDLAPSEDELEQLRKHVDFVPGEAFGSALYRARRTALLEACGDLGFPSALIKGGAVVDPLAGTARVDWSLKLGPRTFVGVIRVVLASRGSTRRSC